MVVLSTIRFLPWLDKIGSTIEDGTFALNHIESLYVNFIDFFLYLQFNFPNDIIFFNNKEFSIHP